MNGRITYSNVISFQTRQLIGSRCDVYVIKQRIGKALNSIYPKLRHLRKKSCRNTCERIQNRRGVELWRSLTDCDTVMERRAK